ncbi:glycerophosphodiester phosphodiesterase family protein [Marimonas lutisalis]|uniref:glycerophosphodiester phosphodiesterase family protein n=1 Tax=Marimonas lutisalis TaxID=2545756 RepID=UPI0013758CAE|nr:glycerophosphodiester phosphodiesterase family protein [Marimonas lutisalis]
MLFGIAALALVSLPGVSEGQTSIEDRLAPGQPPVVISSRARGGGAPDNSLAGIQYAIDRGVDMVEVHIQPTRDGKYILMRDMRLTDGTNVTDIFPDGAPSLAGSALSRRGLTNDYTLEEIAQLRLKDPQGGDHPVPDLGEALDLAQGQVFVLLALQRWDNATLVPLLKRYNPSEILLFTRYGNQRALQEAAEATGIGVATFLNVSNVEGQLEEDLERFNSLLRMIYVTSDQLTPALIAKAKHHRVAIAIVGAAYNDEDDALINGNSGPWLAAFDSGAAAFLTKYPDAVLKLLGR